MNSYKPTHEQRMQERHFELMRNVLYCCLAFIPLYIIINIIVPTKPIPSEILELIKFILYTTFGFFVGSGSSMIPKNK